MTVTRLQRWQAWAPPLFVALLIALMVGLKAATLSCAVTSDPGGYLNCGRRLAEGHFFYPHLGADILQRDFGVTFRDSVIHGYLFANPDGRLYPFFGIGFPLLLAGVIRVLGAEWAPLTNLFLMPVFLAVFYLFVRFSVRDAASARVRVWVPLLSLAVVAWRMEAHLHCWVMPYRELSATTLMLGAVMVAGRERATRLGRWGTLALAGLMAGVAVIIREPVILLGSAAVMARAWQAGAWRTTITRAVGYGLLFAVFVGVAYAPQLAINRAWRGGLTGSKQMDVATTNLVKTDFAADEETVPGFAFFNVRHNFPEHMTTIRSVFGPVLPFLLLGLAIGLKRGYQRMLAVVALPAGLFIAMFSAWGVPLPQPRYDFSYLLLLAPFAALGLAWLVDWLAGLGARWVSPAWGGWVLTLALGVALGFYLSSTVQEMKQKRTRLKPSHLAAFSRDLAAVIPPGSLTLAEIPARDYLEYLAPGNSLGLFQVLEQQVSALDWVQACRRRGTRLFLFLSPNADIQSVPYQSEEWKGLLETEACLTPVRTYSLASYGLEHRFRTVKAALYEVTPLTGRVAVAVAPVVADQPGRLILRLTTRPVTNPPGVCVDGRPVAGRMLGANTYVAELPAPGTASVAIRVDSATPLASAPPAVLLPREAAFGIRFGRDYSDRAWLDRAWFSDAFPSIADHYRVIQRIECGLDLAPLRALYGDTADVFLGAVIENRPTNPGLEWRQQDEPTNGWRTAVRCLDANGLVAGFLLPEARLGVPVMLRPGRAGRVRLYGFCVGRLARDVPCPVVASAGARRLWPVVAWRRDQAGTDGSVFLIQTRLGSAGETVPVRLPAGGDTPGCGYLLLPPLPFRADSTLDDAFTSAARLVWHQGFHAPEREGIWSGSRFAIVLPPVPGPVTVHLQCEDLRPLQAPPALMKARLGDQRLDVRVVRHGVQCEVSITVPGRMEATQAPVQVDMEVTPWQPSLLFPGNSDQRVLGLLMHGVRLSSAPAGASPAN